MNGKISFANLEDIPKINKLLNISSRGEFARKHCWTTEANYLDGVRVTEEYLKKEYLSPNVKLLIYREDESGEIIGCARLKKHENFIQFGMVAVDPYHQNKGIGKILMKSIENYGRDNGINKIRMRVIGLNESLISWYERYGYYKTGETEMYNAPDCLGIPKFDHMELVFMEKILKD